MQQNKGEKMKLKYIGEDSWSRPVYQDQHGHLWKDIHCGNSDTPSLYAAVNDEYDGEPDQPMEQEFLIVQAPNNMDKSFQYMMLGRLRSDCDYYLGYGGRNPDRLCEHNEKKQIEAMKSIWLGFAEYEKPQWLSWEQILDYDRKMCEGK